MRSENENFDESSLRESSNTENIIDLKRKIKLNENSIKDFEGHLRSLLNILNESDIDYAYQIQGGLEKIKYLVEDSITSKQILLREMKKQEELEKEIEKVTKEIEGQKKDLLRDKKGKALLEKNQLLSKINVLSSEVDKYSEINNNYINIIKAKEKSSNFAKILDKMHTIKQENQKLSKIIGNIELNKNFSFDQEGGSHKGNFFSCMGNGRDNYSLNLN